MRPPHVTRVIVLAASWLSLATLALAQDHAATRPSEAKRSPSGVKAQVHPDLSGLWTFATDLPHGDLQVIVDGQLKRSHYDQSARHHASSDVPGALAWEKAPSYKPEYQQKVEELAAKESKVDPVFYCGRPGTPRIGSPRKIVQLPKETIFMYEDSSGDPYRVIPTDGRPHRAKADPSAYGDAIGHWQGGTFVVETTNLAEDTWFGENGYMHSDKMRVVERLWLDAKGNLVYQATVDDPVVLTKPWTYFPRVIAPSDDPISESAPCKEDDGTRLLNLDHHLQR